MRREFAALLIAFLPVAFAASQQPDSPTPRPALAQPANANVYYAGPGVTAPVLYPSTVSISAPQHCVAVNGVVKLSALVDENGVPRDVLALQSDDARLNDFATSFVAAQRFKPGTHNDIPAAIKIAVTAALHTCALPAKKNTPQEDITLTLSSHPFLDIAILVAPSASPETANRVSAGLTAGSEVANHPAGDISVPTPIFQPNPRVAKKAKLKNDVGSCLIGATIDAYGVPQNVKVVTSLEPSLDENAMKAIKTWRFNPALRDATTPVPFELMIAVTFWRDGNTALSFTTIVPRASSTFISTPALDLRAKITSPVLLNADEVQAEYSPYGRLARVTGLCVVAFVVGTDGVPRNVRVVKSLESSMDENVVTAVNELRFKPALKDGTTPVPFEVILPINFRLGVEISKEDLIRSALSEAILIFFRF
jgi:TonB family protein